MNVKDRREKEEERKFWQCIANISNINERERERGRVRKQGYKDNRKRERNRNAGNVIIRERVFYGN
jgi:hypothetical protein